MNISCWNQIITNNNKSKNNKSKNNTRAESPDRKKYVSRKSFEKNQEIIKHHEVAFEKCGGG